MLTVAEMFAGYGGLGLAVAHLTDTKPVWVAENNKHATKVLEKRVKAPNLGNVTEVDWEDVDAADVLLGGVPCQDVSHAGNRAGLRDGTRTGLWAAMRDAIDSLYPSVVVFENVRGLHSAKADSMGQAYGCLGGDCLRATGRVLGDLSELGYDAAWITTPAARVGAPHRRERVFILAARPGGEEALAELTGGSFQEFEKFPKLLPTPAVNDMGAGKEPDVWAAWQEKMRSKHRNGNGHGQSLSIAIREYLDDYDEAIRRWEDVLDRNAPRAVVPGEKVGAKTTLAPTAEFVEWMMGLPEGHVTKVDIPYTQKLKMLGNGVVPRQAAHAISRLAGWLNAS